VEREYRVRPAYLHQPAGAQAVTRRMGGGCYFCTVEWGIGCEGAIIALLSRTHEVLQFGIVSQAGIARAQFHNLLAAWTSAMTDNNTRHTIERDTGSVYDSMHRLAYSKPDKRQPPLWEAECR
jgi:hypothetical protein